MISAKFVASLLLAGAAVLDAFGPTPSSIKFSSSVNPPILGQPVILTATVSPPFATGSVTFFDGVTMIGTKPLAAGQAVLTTSLLESGARSLKAYYGGDATYQPAMSAVLAQTVTALPANGFEAPLSVTIGSYPISAPGDFNGDGKADLAVVSNNTVSILLGKGDGTFQPAVSYAAGDSSGSIAVGDFNGDGNADLVVTNQDDNTVSILLGKGDGTFQPAVTYPAGTYPYGVVVGDFNGDGKADLAVTNLTVNSVTILLGNGDGTFQLPMSYMAGVWPLSLAAGDFNGDGNADLAVVNNTSGTVSVLLGKGDGTFQPAVNYASGASPDSVAVGDLNGDGKPDLAVANASGNTVSVFLGNGDGTFEAAVNYPAGNDPGFAVVGDFNGDGKPDLAFTNYRPGGTYVAVLLGNGNGTFQTPVSYPAGGATVSSLVVGDFNGDGRTDLVVGNQIGTLSVILGNLFVPSTVTLTSSPNPSTYSQNVTLTATVSPSATTGRITFYDGTTVLETKALSNGQASLSSNLLASGVRSLKAYYSGDATYQPSTSAAIAQTVTTLPANGFQAPVNYGAGTYITAVAVGDFNGDGKPDLVVISGSVSVYLGNGDGTLRAPLTYATTNQPTSVAVGDFNGDGKADLAVMGLGSVGVLLGNGDGTFQAPVYYFSGGSNGGYVVVGDFNGDGKPDLAVTTSVYSGGLAGSVAVLLGNGDGTFLLAVSYSTGSGSGQPLTVGDFNGDGIADLLVGGSVFLGNRDGTFTQTTGSPTTGVVGDFNGDGKADIAGGSGVALGNGDGTFRPLMPYPFSFTANSVAVGDFNGDGKPDLAAPSSSGVSVLLGNGDGDFQPAVSYAAGNYTLVVVADFNGDGRPDIAAVIANNGGVSVLLSQLVAATTTTTMLTSSANPVIYGQPVSLTATVAPSTATGLVTFYDGATVLGTGSPVSGQAKLTTSLLASGTRSLKAYYRGAGAFLASASAALAESVTAIPANALQPTLNFATGTNPESVAVGDFNGDGKADLAIANKGGNVSVLMGSGNGLFQTAVNYAAGGHPISVAAGDFNLDGNTDLAVANFDSGTVSVLLGLGYGSFLPAVNYSAGANPYSVVVGDFNGDGEPDLAVANNGSGNVSILLGNGDGLFQAAVNYNAGTNPTSVVAGDFNGDGKTDLAVVNNHDGTVSVLLGNGDGTFRAAVNYPVGANPFSAAVGDFNGDGKLDLAVANYNDNNVSVLLGNGDGTFQAAVKYSAGANPYSVTVGDFNGDGKPDLVVTNNTGSTVSALPGNGNGTFEAPVSVSAGLNPNSAAVGDFNGDGRTDLAVTNFNGNSVSILLGSGNPPTQLKFTAQPVNGLVGVALPAVMVQTQDQNGNLVTGTTSPVTVTSTPSGIDTTVTTVNGVATFGDLVLSAAGSYTLTASSVGLTSAASNPFNIVNAPPSVVIESPTAGAALTSGTITISGWALDNTSAVGTAIGSVQVLLDGIVAGNATYGISRPDICSTYPGRPGCPNVGFSYSLNLAPGTHAITVTATDSDAVPDMGSASVTVTVQGPMTGTRVGVFRNNISFLEDSNGSQAYEAGIDRYIPSFTGPGGYVTGDVAVVGDWTGDGHAKVGVYRTPTGTWYLDANNDGVYDAGDYTYSFGGLPGDMPFVGDWNGVMGISTYKSCIGIYRSPQSEWLLDLNCNGVFDNTPADAFFPFGGLAGDVPVVGNWTGTHTRVGVVRSYAPLGVPIGPPFFWVYDNSPANAGNLPANHQPAANCFAFGGLPGDVFVTGDWYNTGVSTAGVFRTGYWVLDAALPGAPLGNHITGLSFGFGGVAGDVPVTGKW